MATYLELYSAADGGTQADLRKKITVAISVKANMLAKATPTATQKAWATAALANPVAYLETLLHYILADYNTATIAVISTATDAQVQTAVNSAVDTLLGA